MNLRWGGVALLAAAAGFAGYRWLADPGARAMPEPVETATPTAPAAAVGGPAATEDTLAPPARVIPERLPDIRMMDDQGVRRSLAEFRGRPLIVNFWATWCAPCRREIPLLNRLRKDYAADKLEVVGIAIDFRDDVLEYRSSTAIDYPVLVGEDEGSEAAARFGMEANLPFSIFADSAGRIVAVKVGELHANEAVAIMTGLRDLEGGRSTLGEVQTRLRDQMKLLATARAKASS